jgi:hypothetical protein
MAVCCDRRKRDDQTSNKQTKGGKPVAGRQRQQSLLGVKAREENSGPPK